MDALHNSSFYIISINFKALCQQETRASYQQPFLHFFNNLVIIPKPSPTNGIFEGSKEMET